MRVLPRFTVPSIERVLLLAFALHYSDIQRYLKDKFSIAFCIGVDGGGRSWKSRDRSAKIPHKHSEEA